jgi:hypothetical protein
MVHKDTGSVLLVRLCLDAVLGAEDTHRQLTEKYGCSLLSANLYLGDSYFQSRPGQPFYSLWFSVVFLSPSNAYTVTSLKISHHLSQFMTYCHIIVVRSDRN